jgi:hypothetical protein
MAPAHLDESTKLPVAEVSVFLNCPFDEKYAPLLNATILAVLSCGFVPRSADEDRLGASLPRMERIRKALHGSRYSIHDLCRCRGEGDDNLGRFNMPLELGIAIGRHYATRDDPEHKHNWLVLTPGDHIYLKFISDLAGFDPKVHDETPKMLVRAVMAWLLANPGSPGYYSGITPNRVIAALPKFDSLLEKHKAHWEGTPPWEVRVTAGRTLVAELEEPRHKEDVDKHK